MASLKIISCTHPSHQLRESLRLDLSLGGTTGCRKFLAPTGHCLAFLTQMHEDLMRSFFERFLSHLERDATALWRVQAN